MGPGTSECKIGVIRGNLGDFEEFGRVAFQMQPFETPGGLQNQTLG
jgi:hypothetical protein